MNSLELIPFVSKQVRFRQILKKHGLMELAPKTPQSQAQKRKAASKSKERPDDDDDGGSSYHPSPVAAKASARKRSARASGGRAKMQKVDVQSKDDQDDDDQEDEEAVADGVVAAAASAPSAELDTEPNVETKTDAKTEIKAEADSGSDTGMAPLNDDGVTGGIDGTNSASPHEYGRDQATQGQGFSGGMDHLMAPFHRQSALPANLGEVQMMQLQLRRPSMGSSGYGQQLNPYQLSALQAVQDPRLQPHQMTSEVSTIFLLLQFPVFVLWDVPGCRDYSRRLTDLSSCSGISSGWRLRRSCSTASKDCRCSPTSTRLATIFRLVTYPRCS